MSDSGDVSTGQVSSAPPSPWWEYLHYAAHEAFTYSLARQGNDPRGPPGLIGPTSHAFCVPGGPYPYPAEPNPPPDLAM